MVQAAKKVGEKRYRETFGRYYEDFTPGDVYEHRPGRTITQTDNIWFTLLTMNTHPMHFDEEYAKASEFGQCIICSPLTVAVVPPTWLFCVVPTNTRYWLAPQLGTAATAFQARLMLLVVWLGEFSPPGTAGAALQPAAVTMAMTNEGRRFIGCDLRLFP